MTTGVGSACTYALGNTTHLRKLPDFWIHSNALDILRASSMSSQLPTRAPRPN